MKRINSTEMKGVLDSDLLKRSRYDPDSASCLTNCSTINSHTLKRSQSTSTLRSSKNDLSIIEERYQTLEQDYTMLLRQAQRKKNTFLRQKAELVKYKSYHQRDRKQIERLQSLISLAKRTEIAFTKTTFETGEASTNLRKPISNSSVPKDKNFALKKVTTEPVDILNSKQTCNGIRKMGKKHMTHESQTQFLKHKFVPSYCLN